MFKTVLLVLVDHGPWIQYYSVQFLCVIRRCLRCVIFSQSSFVIPHLHRRCIVIAFFFLNWHNKRCATGMRSRYRKNERQEVLISVIIYKTSKDSEDGPSQPSLMVLSIDVGEWGLDVWCQGVDGQSLPLAFDALFAPALYVRFGCNAMALTWYTYDRCQIQVPPSQRTCQLREGLQHQTRLWGNDVCPLQAQCFCASAAEILQDCPLRSSFKLIEQVPDNH